MALPYPMFGPPTYVSSSSKRGLEVRATQTEGLKPAGCVLEMGNWCGMELASYSTSDGCWNVRLHSETNFQYSIANDLSGFQNLLERMYGLLQLRRCDRGRQLQNLGSQMYGHGQRLQCGKFQRTTECRARPYTPVRFAECASTGSGDVEYFRRSSNSSLCSSLFYNGFCDGGGVCSQYKLCSCGSGIYICCPVQLCIRGHLWV